jgi:hypothetical protein
VKAGVGSDAVWQKIGQILRRKRGVGTHDVLRSQCAALLGSLHRSAGIINLPLRVAVQNGWLCPGIATSIWLYVSLQKMQCLGAPKDAPDTISI